MTAPVPVNDLVASLRQAGELGIRVAGRYHPGRHRRHHGFLQHAFATSPWLGAMVVVVIVLGVLALALIKSAGRVIEGTPWYVRVALLVTAGLGLFRLLSRKDSGPAPGSWVPPDTSRPSPPWDEPA
jgi:hypothetical protein